MWDTDILPENVDYLLTRCAINRIGGKGSSVPDNPA
jgi:hypothetical protein